jgi:folate-binding protein YgfZ
MTFRLPPPQVLDISGPDAVAFAHAQFGSDVRTLPHGQWQWSAWLSAQGRVRALFRLLRVGDDTLRAVLRGGSAEDLRRHLSPFVLRSRVRLDAAAVSAVGCFSEPDVHALLGTAPLDKAIVAAGVRSGIAIEGQRWLVLGDDEVFADDDVGALERWRAADIEAGLVDLAPGQLDRFLPAALGLGRLGAVSVRKGCYPGQEIVARLHFKGGNKRWLHRLAFTAAELPVPGTELVATGADAPGEVLQAAWTVPPGGVALAVLPESPAGAELSVPSTSVANFRVVSAIDDAND